MNHSNTNRLRRFATRTGIGLLGLMGAAAAQAHLVMSAVEIDGDVVVNVSGTLNTTDLTPGFAGNGAGVVNPEFGVFFVGPSFVGFDQYTGLNGPTDIGPGIGGLSTSIFPTSGSGGLVGVTGDSGALRVPAGYVSGDPISAEMVFAGRTLNSMGLDAGTYEWTWGAGANADSITLKAFRQSKLRYELTEYLNTGDNVQVPGEAPGVAFQEFDSETPSLDNGVLCFEGRFGDPNGLTEGVFTIDADGTISRFVTSLELNPNPFDVSLNLELLSDGVVSWDASFGTGAGIYGRAADGSGGLLTYVDANTPIPGAAGATFDNFGEYGRDGDFLIFEGRGSGGVEGIYILDIVSGVTTFVLDENTPSFYPTGAGAVFSFIGEPMVRDGRFTFKAGDTNGNRGLLTDFNDGNGFVTAARAGLPLAGPHGVVGSAFDESSIDGDCVVWQGSVTNTNNSNSAIMYDHATATATVIANEFIPRPDALDGGFFNGFNGNPSLNITEDGRTVIVWETGDTREDIWAWIDGTYVPVVRQGDDVNGRIVTNVSHRFPYSLEGTTTAVRLKFDDGTEGLYLAELVAPADTNGDACIDLTDLANVLAGFGMGPGAGVMDGDVNGDGFVDLTDLAEVLGNFGLGC